MDRLGKAIEYFTSGYNCAQSTAVAFSEDMGYTDLQVLRLSSALGAGFSKTRGLCGAVLALGLVIGAICSNANEDGDSDKEHIYTITQDLMKKFETANGTLICKELLVNVDKITYTPIPEDRTEQYYSARPCIKLVVNAVTIAQDYLIKHKYINE